MLNISIVHEPTKNEPFLIINKPSFLPSAPIKENDDCALTQAIKLFPEIKNVSGKKEIEYGLVHRIDNDTKGLILIATTQEFYDFIQETQKNGAFIKSYKATVKNILDCKEKLLGFPSTSPILQSEKEIEVSSFFRFFGEKNSQVRPVTEDCGKAALKKCGKVLYTTKIELSKDKKTALCSLSQGFRHQVRTHLAWCGYPIVADKIYNPEKTDKNFDFTAYKLTFPGFEIEI